MKTLLACLICLGLLSTAVPEAVAVQEENQEAIRLVAPPVQQDEVAQKPQEKKKEEGPIVDTSSQVSKIDVDPREIRLHMWDGSIVTGIVGVEAINMETEFGRLRIPVNKIVRFVPGLKSNAARKKEIDELVEQLGSRSFDEREAAHKKLAQMGSKLKKVIGTYQDGGSAERKKHLTQLKSEIATMSDEFEGADEAIFGFEDRVDTPKFSIVGRLVETSFDLQTKYGKLSIQLADIQKGDRQFYGSSEPIRKDFKVAADAFLQNAPVSTRIRVRAGDKISINASGMAVWTSWGNVTSNPDGVTNRGFYQGIPSGRLVARIGENGPPISVGTKKSFVAKKPGVLYLGVAMEDRYARPDRGYRWSGTYNAKLVIEPNPQ